MRRDRKLIIIIVVILVVAVLIIAGLILFMPDDDNQFRVFGGSISVENGIEEEVPTIKVFNMFITPDKVAEDKSNVILEKAEVTGEGYLNNCVFLGDSRTVAMVNFACINDDDALAQIGISHMAYSKNTFTNNAGKQYTLKSYLASHQKPVIYISLGVNGMNGISEEDYEKSYSNLVDYCIEAAPNSDIVLMSIWPVDDNGPYKSSVQNEWISKYNDFLYEMAKEKQIHFLNINEILTSDSGQIKTEYDAGDGLHYNKKAYDAIMKYIVEHPVPGVSVEGEYSVKYIKPKVTNVDNNTAVDDTPMDDDALMQLYLEALSGGQNQETEISGTTPETDAEATPETDAGAASGTDAGTTEEEPEESQEPENTESVTENVEESDSEDYFGNMFNSDSNGDLLGNPYGNNPFGLTEEQLRELNLL